MRRGILPEVASSWNRYHNGTTPPAGVVVEMSPSVNLIRHRGVEVGGGVVVGVYMHSVAYIQQ